MSGRRSRVLAVSSGGGHWVELMRLAPAFEGHFVVYATVSRAYEARVGGAPLYVIRDVTRWDPLGALVTVAQLARLLVSLRPDVVVSTGALPGFFGVLLGKLAGARTIWVDSLANADELSLSGKAAGRCADLWLTQWPELATPGGPLFRGNILD